jgi:hypothetical protein
MDMISRLMFFFVHILPITIPFMTFNVFFNIIIYSTILLVSIWTIRVYVHTIKSRLKAANKYKAVETNIKEVKNKGQIVEQHISLANNFEKILFYRFFEINKQLIEIQKLLLKSN